MFSYRWKLQTVKDGEIICAPSEVRKTIDKRGPYDDPQLVYEVFNGKLWKRYWPEDLVRVEQEAFI